MTPKPDFSSIEFVPSAASDGEDVVWALQTAESLWKKGEAKDAIVWLRRASQAATDDGADDRAAELEAAAVSLTARVAQVTAAFALVSEGLFEPSPVIPRSQPPVGLHAPVAKAGPPPLPSAGRGAPPPLPSRIKPPVPKPVALPKIAAPMPAEPSEEAERISLDSLEPDERISLVPTSLDDEDIAVEVDFDGSGTKASVHPPSLPPAASVHPPSLPPTASVHPPSLPPTASVHPPSLPPTASVHPPSLPPAVSVHPRGASVPPPLPHLPSVPPVPADEPLDEDAAPSDTLANLLRKQLSAGSPASLRTVTGSEPPVSAPVSSDADSDGRTMIHDHERPSTDLAQTVDRHSYLAGEVEAAPSEGPHEEPVASEGESLSAVESAPVTVFQPSMGDMFTAGEVEAATASDEPALSVDEPAMSADAPTSAKIPDAPSSLAQLTADLSEVTAFADLPDDVRDLLASRAAVVELFEGDSVALGSLGYVLQGAVEVTGEGCEAPVHLLSGGDVLIGYGNILPANDLRLFATGQGAIVALWENVAVAEALAHCPWVLDELRELADPVQTRAGLTLGPLGNRVDASLLTPFFEQLEASVFDAGAEIFTKGARVPGLTILAVGEAIVRAPTDEDGEHLKVGAFLFPDQVLSGGKCPASIFAGEGGATVLVADRSKTQELLATAPFLIELLAGM